MQEISADAAVTRKLSLRLQMLHRQKSDLPVFIISQTENLRKEAAKAGVDDYFVQPVTEQKLRDAIQSVKNKEKAS